MQPKTLIILFSPFASSCRVLALSQNIADDGMGVQVGKSIFPKTDHAMLSGKVSIMQYIRVGSRISTTSSISRIRYFRVFSFWDERRNLHGKFSPHLIILVQVSALHMVPCPKIFYTFRTFQQKIDIRSSVNSKAFYQM